MLCRLLRYLAKRAVAEPGVPGKEFQIATEALGRSADFDPRFDSNVRVQTARLRAKLMEYYASIGAQNSVVLEIPKGSYVLLLRHRDFAEAKEELPPPPQIENETAKIDSTPAESTRNRMRWWKPAIAAFVAGILVAGWWSYMQRQSAFEQFWQPVFASSSPVLVTLGQVHVGEANLTPNSSRSPFSGVYHLCEGQCAEGNGRGFVALFDSRAAANVAAVLRNGKKNFSIRDLASTSFTDLQKGPSVLIGGFSNDWAVRLTNPLRFHFDMDPQSQTWWIADRQHPEARIGIVSTLQPSVERKQDFALVVRMQDSSTGQVAVILAGIGGQGTQAAGDFVASPELLKQMEVHAPKNWSHQNMEFLLSTEIVEGQPGSPHLVDIAYW